MENKQPGFNEMLSLIQQKGFETAALEIFHFQSLNTPVYASFLQHLGVEPEKIEQVEEIPFLPIEFFKTLKVLAKGEVVKFEFGSSGTAGPDRSVHFVSRPEIYEQSYLKGFKAVYGEPSDLIILALLPSYLERKDSSLIYMVQGLMEKSANPQQGFFKDLNESFIRHLQELQQSEKKVLLIGVTFALLELCEKINYPLHNTVILETGGMKGRGKEITREELHSLLREKLQPDAIHSEYGMTELFSQAYATRDGIFHTPPWMKVWIREVNDPLSYCNPGKTGGINVIDLANLYSCSFIATKDLGRLHDEGKFEVLGRFDNSDVRGCNLLL